MSGHFLRVSEDDLERLIALTEEITDFLYPDDRSGRAPGQEVDLDRAWSILDFLLTDRAGEGEGITSDVILGGIEFTEDLGTGPARYYRPKDVHRAARELIAIEPEELWKRFDLEAVETANVYPRGWSGSSSERDYVVEAFQRLKAFFVQAAKSGDAVIGWIL